MAGTHQEHREPSSALTILRAPSQRLGYRGICLRISLICQRLIDRKQPQRLYDFLTHPTARFHVGDDLLKRWLCLELAVQKPVGIWA